MMLGEDGALAGSKAGNILVDMTTSEPSLAVEIYEVAQAKDVPATRRIPAPFFLPALADRGRWLGAIPVRVTGRCCFGG